MSTFAYLQIEPEGVVIGVQKERERATGANTAPPPAGLYVPVQLIVADPPNADIPSSNRASIAKLEPVLH